MASKASLDEQQKQVQDNIHAQISTICTHMDEILLPDAKMPNTVNSSPERNSAPRRSGLGLAVGRTLPDNPGE